MKKQLHEKEEEVIQLRGQLKTATAHAQHMTSLQSREEAVYDFKHVKDWMGIPLTKGYIVYQGLPQNPVDPMSSEDVNKLFLEQRVPADGFKQIPWTV